MLLEAIHAQARILLRQIKLDEDRPVRLVARLANEIVWIGRFRDRDEADVFLIALARGELARDDFARGLSLPAWDPRLEREPIVYEFAVAFVQSAVGVFSTSTGKSQAIDSTGGDFLAGYVYSLQDPGASSATYAGQAMTAVPGTPVADGTRRLLAFFIKNPATGLNNFTTVYTNSVDSVIGAQVFSGTAGTVSGSQTAVNTTATGAVTSSPASLVAAASYSDNAVAAQLTAGTTDYSTLPSSVNVAAGHVAGAASVTPTWNATQRLLLAFNIDPQIVFGFDQVTGPTVRRNPGRGGSIARGHNPVQPQQQFFPAGWQVQDPQPPHPRRERSGAVAPKEDGIEAPFVYVPPLGNVPAWQFSAQEVQPPAPRVSQRMAGIIPGDNSGTNAQPPLVQFFDFGWPVQPPQPPGLPYRRMFAALLSGDASDQNNQPAIVPFFDLGWPIQPPQPPTPTGRSNQRAGAIMQGDFGAYDRERPFFQFGFENQSWQPPHRDIARKFGAVAVGDFGAWDRFRRFFDYGWSVQPPQPPHPAPERRAGAVMPIEPGIEAKYIFIAPTILWESGEQSYGPPGRRYRQEAAIMRGVDGTDAPFIRFRPFASTEFAPTLRSPPRRYVEFGDAGIEAIPIPNVWGWDPRLLDPRARPRVAVPAAFQALIFPHIFEPSWTEDTVDLLRRRPLVAATEMEPAYVPLPPPVRWGFDPETEALARHRRHVAPTVDERLLPPFPRVAWGWDGVPAVLAARRRRQAFDEPAVLLPRLLGWGFASALPDLRARPLRRTLDRGYELVTSFSPVWTSGWEIQPSQPPRPPWGRSAGLMRGVDGTDFPLIVPHFDGWESTLFFPPHPRPERGGAVMIGDVWGAWGLFYYLIPSGAIATDSALYAAIAFDVGVPP